MKQICVFTQDSQASIPYFKQFQLYDPQSQNNYQAISVCIKAQEDDLSKYYILKLNQIGHFYHLNDMKLVPVNNDVFRVGNKLSASNLKYATALIKLNYEITIDEDEDQYEGLNLNYSDTQQITENLLLAQKQPIFHKIYDIFNELEAQSQIYRPEYNFYKANIAFQNIVAERKSSINKQNFNITELLENYTKNDQFQLDLLAHSFENSQENNYENDIIKNEQELRLLVKNQYNQHCILVCHVTSKLYQEYTYPGKYTQLLFTESPREIFNTVKVKYLLKIAYNQKSQSIFFDTACAHVLNNVSFQELQKQNDFPNQLTKYFSDLQPFDEKQLKQKSDDFVVSCVFQYDEELLIPENAVKKNYITLLHILNHLQNPKVTVDEVFQQIYRFLIHTNLNSIDQGFLIRLLSTLLVNDRNYKQNYMKIKQEQYNKLKFQLDQKEKDLLKSLNLFDDIELYTQHTELINYLLLYFQNIQIIRLNQQQSNQINSWEISNCPSFYGALQRMQTDQTDNADKLLSCNIFPNNKQLEELFIKPTKTINFVFLKLKQQDIQSQKQPSEQDGDLEIQNLNGQNQMQIQSTNVVGVQPPEIALSAIDIPQTTISDNFDNANLSFIEQDDNQNKIVIESCQIQQEKFQKDRLSHYIEDSKVSFDQTQKMINLPLLTDVEFLDAINKINTCQNHEFELNDKQTDIKQKIDYLIQAKNSDFSNLHFNCVFQFVIYVELFGVKYPLHMSSNVLFLSKEIQQLNYENKINDQIEQFNNKFNKSIYNIVCEIYNMHPFYENRFSLFSKLGCQVLINGQEFNCPNNFKFFDQLAYISKPGVYIISNKLVKKFRAPGGYLMRRTVHNKQVQIDKIEETFLKMSDVEEAFQEQNEVYSEIMKFKFENFQDSTSKGNIDCLFFSICTNSIDDQLNSIIKPQYNQLIEKQNLNNSTVRVQSPSARSNSVLNTADSQTMQRSPSGLQISRKINTGRDFDKSTMERIYRPEDDPSRTQIIVLFYNKDTIKETDEWSYLTKKFSFQQSFEHNTQLFEYQLESQSFHTLGNFRNGFIPKQYKQIMEVEQTKKFFELLQKESNLIYQELLSKEKIQTQQQYDIDQKQLEKCVISTLSNVAINKLNAIQSFALSKQLTEQISLLHVITYQTSPLNKFQFINKLNLPIVKQQYLIEEEININQFVQINNINFQSVMFGQIECMLFSQDDLKNNKNLINNYKNFQSQLKQHEQSEEYKRIQEQDKQEKLKQKQLYIQSLSKEEKSNMMFEDIYDCIYDMIDGIDKNNVNSEYEKQLNIFKKEYNFQVKSAKAYLNQEYANYSTLDKLVSPYSQHIQNCKQQLVQLTETVSVISQIFAKELKLHTEVNKLDALVNDMMNSNFNAKDQQTKFKFSDVNNFRNVVQSRYQENNFDQQKVRPQYDVIDEDTFAVKQNARKMFSVTQDTLDEIKQYMNDVSKGTVQEQVQDENLVIQEQQISLEEIEK